MRCRASKSGQQLEWDDRRIAFWEQYFVSYGSLLTRDGRDAHGATITATVGEAQVLRRVQPDGSYLASSDPRVHFGLGEEKKVSDVTVRWIDGKTETFGASRRAATSSYVEARVSNKAGQAFVRLLF